MPIKCKEQRSHVTVTFVKQLEVIGLNGMQEHEDQMTVGDKSHPEGCSLSQVAPVYLLHVGVVLLDQCLSGRVFEGSTEILRST